MGKTIGAFDFEIDGNGARVVCARKPLHPQCLTDGEIDGNIELLKEALDAVAQQMKAAIRAQAKELAKKPLEFG